MSPPQTLKTGSESRAAAPSGRERLLSRCRASPLTLSLSHKGRGDSVGPTSGYFPAIIGMHIIMGMPPHIIIMGMPAPIMVIMRWQHSLNISMDMPSPGMTLHIIMPPDISQLIFIIGTAIGIMPGIIDIMLFIMGIMAFIMGMPPIMGIMSGIIGMLAGMAPVICVAVFISLGSLLRLSSRATGLSPAANSLSGFLRVARARRNRGDATVCILLQ